MIMQLYKTIQDKRLKIIAEKVYNNSPVTIDDAEIMLTTNNILDLGHIANYMRTKIHGDTTYYSVNINLNYTNICELRCPLCAYSCDENSDNAFLLTPDEIETRIRNAVLDGVDEVHIVGGLHPRLRIDYYESMLRLIKSIKHDMHIVAFTAVEYDYFSKKENLPLETVFQRLIDAGLGAVPGGGAEIFSHNVRSIISPKKISGERWLEVMKTAHRMGLKTNATMLYGHIEGMTDIIDHLARIRHLQDDTGGFKTFVPLRFHDKNTEIRVDQMATGYDDIRIYATSRIFLHNIPHIKALWMYIGDKMAQVLQRFGVDDIGGTYNQEKVVHAAGAATPVIGSESHLRNLIENAGLKPVRVTSNYRQASERNFL
jgi:aminodeoxyfutalosine synthase